MTNKILSILLFLLLGKAISLKAEYFKNLNLENGLSQFSVMSICQDELGRMWFGTREGINVYDGRRIQYYRGWVNNGISERVWLGNDIKCIQRSTNGNIYFLADQNLFQYDIRKEKFSQLTNDNNTTSLAFKKDELWYTKQDSIFLWKYQLQSHRYIKKVPAKKTTAIIVSNNGTLYIGSNNGIFVTDTVPSGSIRQILEKKEIYSIYESTKQGIWIGTRMHGLFRIKQGQLIEVPYSSTDGEGISDIQVREFVEDNHHNIWFGTFSGLQKFDARTGRYSKVQTPQYLGGLSHPSIYSLYKDRQGIIWVGSYYGGVSSFNPNREEYFHYNYQIHAEHDVYYSYIGEMVQDKHGCLWLSTDGGGISRLDSEWNLQQLFTSKRKNSLPHNNVKSIAYYEKDDLLFIGTYLGGLSKYDIQKQQFYNYFTDEQHTQNRPGNIINCVKVWNDNLYLTSQKGMFKLDIQTDQFTFLEGKGKFCDYFDIDNQGNLYIMGWNDIQSFSLEKDVPDDSIALSDYGYKGRLNHILATEEGLYICTLGAGLFFWNKETHTVLHYTYNNSQLPSDYCYNIKQIDIDEFIVSSDKGVSLFSPKRNEISTINITQDIPVINGGGIFISSDQDIYVGDTKGVTFFSKETFRNYDRDKNPIYFSRLYINNQLIVPQQGKNILQQALPFTRKLELKHNQNNCIIEFSSSDYKNRSHRQLFEYMLKGFDKKWITTSSNEIHYTNLDPGNYILQVRPLGEEKQKISLDITIYSPWYLQWWAWLLYLATSVFVLTYYLYNKKVQRTLSLSVEKERMEKQHIEELNHAKLVFFTNVSHEFRTPLTLIASHTDALLQNQLLPPQIYNKILKIKQNAQQMTNLVAELLDFRRFTQNRFTLQVSKRDINEFLKEIYLLFNDYAYQSDIRYDFHCNPTVIDCWFDAKQLEKVFFNLLSNAFKYTRKGGKIEIIVSIENGKVKIQIRDNGCGISDSDSIHIFDRFYQGNNQKGTEQTPGTGIGLALTKSIVEKHHGTIRVESEEGKGSVFTLLLPLDKNVYTNDKSVQFIEDIPKDSLQIEIINNVSEIVNDTNNLTIEKGDDTTEKKKSILLVEDNEELLLVLKQLFEPFYKVYLACNGKEGIALTYKHKPDLILSDIMMPEMNGTEMCLQIKNNIDLCHIPIILLTALNGVEQNLEGLNRGADAYICKPFDSRLLLARVNNLIRNRQLIQNQIKKQPITEIDLTSINPLDQKLLKEVSNIIEENIDNIDLNVSLLCRKIGMGRTIMYSKFKVLTGMSPNNFIINFRLKHAASLLLHQKELSIAEISDRCGFSSPTYFGYCFKNYYKTTPQSYRKNHSD